jgi:hypothetical protein
LAFHVEVNLSGFPFVAGFGQEGGDQPQEGGFIDRQVSPTKLVDSLREIFQVERDDF